MGWFAPPRELTNFRTCGLLQPGSSSGLQCQSCSGHFSAGARRSTGTRPSPHTPAVHPGTITHPMYPLSHTGALLSTTLSLRSATNPTSYIRGEAIFHDAHRSRWSGRGSQLWLSSTSFARAATYGAWATGPTHPLPTRVPGLAWGEGTKGYCSGPPIASPMACRGSL